MWSNQENRVRKQVKNLCEAHKIKASQNLHKIISTHLLTVLIIRVILHIEQREREKIKDLLEFGSKNENNNSWHICQVKNGGMTYVNAQCIWKRYF